MSKERFPYFNGAGFTAKVTAAYFESLREEEGLNPRFCPDVREKIIKFVLDIDAAVENYVMKNTKAADDAVDVPVG